MKISSVSKKVLASALSAAMVVAFAPTAAFAAPNPAITASSTPTAKVIVSAYNTVTGAPVSYEKLYFNVNGYTGLDKALDDVSDVAKANLNETDGSSNGDGKIVIEYAAATATTAAKYAELNLGTGALKAVNASGVAVNAAGQTEAEVGGGSFVQASYGTVGISKVAVQLLDNVVDTTVYKGSKAITLDLNGFTLSNYADQDKANDAGTLTAAVDTLTVNDNVTLDGAGKVVAFDKLKADGSFDTNGNADSVVGAVTIANATVGDIEGGLTVAKKGTAVAGKVSSVTVNDEGAATVGVVAGTATVNEKASLTVEAKGGKDDDTVTAVEGLLTAEKEAVVKVTASAIKDGAIVTGANAGISVAKDSNVSIDVTASGANSKVYGAKLHDDTTIGNYSSTNPAQTYGAVVSIAAAATGIESGGQTVVKALGSNGHTLTVKGGKLTVKAEAADADAEANGVTGVLTVQDKGDAEVSALVAGDWDVNQTNNTSVAVGNLSKASAGTYTGLVTNLGTLTGGSYTVKPEATTNYDENSYELADDGKYWTVQQYAGYDLSSTSLTEAPNVSNETLPTDFSTAEQEAIVKAVKNALNGKAGGATFAYAEGQSLDTLKAQSKAKEKLTVYYTFVKYNAKKATEAEKAAYDALVAKAAADKTVIDGEVYFPSIFVGYKASTATSATKLADVTGFGTSTSGRETTENVATLYKADDADIKAYGEGMIVYANGAASALQPVVDSRDKTKPNHFVVTGMPTAFAWTAVNIKDIQEGETPAPAPEKATQSVDVAQKSKTVKLAKGKTKTQKAVSFKLGASAETALTIAKKSGSSKISVSGQKITLKKGTKKGTFTAKVSIKAAASDEYLAAAKTITVKFVVKK